MAICSFAYAVIGEYVVQHFLGIYPHTGYLSKAGNGFPKVFRDKV